VLIMVCDLTSTTAARKGLQVSLSVCPSVRLSETSKHGFNFCRIFNNFGVCDITKFDQVFENIVSLLLIAIRIFVSVISTLLE